MKNLLLPALLFFASSVIAQNPNWHVFHGPLRVFDIALDGDEAWIATPPLGVVRMNKNTGEWENFSSLNAPFPNNLVTQIETDPQGRVWMATLAYGEPSGLMLYDHGTWETILQLPNGAPIIDARIAKDCTGRIWLKNDDWKLYSIENLVWTDRSSEFGQIPLTYCDNTVGVERWTSADTLLIRYDNNGIASFALPDSIQAAVASGSTFQFDQMTPIARFSNNEVLVRVNYYFEWDDETTYLFKYYTFDGLEWKVAPPPFDHQDAPSWVLLGDDERLYVRLQNKFYHFNGDTLTEVNLPGISDLSVEVQSVDEEGNFWVTQNVYGANVGQSLFWKFNSMGGLNYPAFTNAPIPRTIFSDDNTVVSNSKGEIWFDGGSYVARITEQGWETFPLNQVGPPPPQFQSKYIRGIFLDWQGNPWLTLGPDIYTLNDFTPMRWDGSQWQACDHFFHAIAFAPDGATYWYTDLYDQLHRRNGTLDEVFDHNNTPTLPVDGLKELTFDSDGALWAMSAEYPGRIYKRSTDWVEMDTPDVYPQFTEIKAGKQGGIWVNNSWEIWHYDAAVWTKLDSNWTVYDNFHYSCLTPDQDASAWIGYDGLLHWNGATAEQIDIINAKLPYNFVGDIAIDTFGNKWLATYYGLAVYNENGLQIDSYLTHTHEPPPTQITDFISPNPFSESTQLDLKKLDFAPQHLSVFNAQGILVLAQNLQNQETTQINRNSLPAGLYFVVVEGNGKSVVGKLVAR